MQSHTSLNSQAPARSPTAETIKCHCLAISRDRIFMITVKESLYVNTLIDLAFMTESSCTT
jgi:hypothetical protein